MDIEKELQAIRRELERIVALGRPRPGLATREEAAEFLAVSVATVDRKIASGEIPKALIAEGRQVRIPWSALHRLAQPAVPQMRAGPRRGPRTPDIAEELAKVKEARRARSKRR